MGVFILAGYQQSLAQHIKKALAQGEDQFNGWTWDLFPSEKRNEATILAKQVENLCRLAEAHGGAHIFAVSADRQRQQIEDQLRRHFRFRWLDSKVIGETGRGEFAPLIEALSAATLEEAYWAQHVKPADSSSPLILPEIFRPIRELEGIWRLSESYNNQGHLVAATGLLERFSREHRRRIDKFENTPWLGDDSWIWNDGGARHGNPDFPGDWRYSYRLPDGFHFDVSPHAKKKTFFVDAHGRRHPLPEKGYLNVTAHGLLRGPQR
jgi:hypothetical protein